MSTNQKPLSFSLCPLNIEYVLSLVANKKKTDKRYNRSVYMDDLITKLRVADEQKCSMVATTKNEYIPLFDQFWDMYGKKVGRPKCEKLWIKISKHKDRGKNLQKIFEVVELYVESKPDKKFRKDPERWLKNECWNDEIEVSNGQINGNNARSGQKESSHERIKRENDIKYRGSEECGLGVGADDRHLGGAVGTGERVETIGNVDNQPFIDY